MKKTALSSLFFLIASGTPALAHLNPDEHGSFAAGLSHPLFGMDHVMVMIAVGLWAWQIGKSAIWIVPSAFVGTMVFGFVLALTGMSLPFVEPVILASIVTIGLLVALAIEVPIMIGAIVVAAFALFHGYAHGSEIGGATQFAYAAGFAVATAFLHATGVMIGYALNALFGGKTKVAMNVTRTLGGITFLAGLGLFAA